jgi:hypothetical protein
MAIFLGDYQLIFNTYTFRKESKKTHVIIVSMGYLAQRLLCLCSKARSVGCVFIMPTEQLFDLGCTRQ